MRFGAPNTHPGKTDPYIYMIYPMITSSLVHCNSARCKVAIKMKIKSSNIETNVEIERKSNNMFWY